MIYLPCDLYTVEAGDKISDASKYPLVLFPISKWKKYGRLSQITQLSHCSKSTISPKHTQTGLSINDQTVNVRITKLAFLSYM